jgi:Tfp pilus assembly protein PilW
MRRQARELLGDQRGVTLVELLFYIGLSLVVIVAPLYFVITSINQQNNVSSRTSAARQAEAGLEQMTRDLRQAMSQDGSGNALSVTVSNPTSATTAISFDIPTPGNVTSPQAVTWTCPSTGASSVGTCTRKVGSGASEAEITGVSSVTFAPISSSGASMTLPATNPAYVNVTLLAQATSQLDTTKTHSASGIANPIKVQTGVDLRNFG